MQNPRISPPQDAPRWIANLRFAQLRSSASRPTRSHSPHPKNNQKISIYPYRRRRGADRICPKDPTSEREDQQILFWEQAKGLRDSRRFAVGFFSCVHTNAVHEIEAHSHKIEMTFSWIQNLGISPPRDAPRRSRVPAPQVKKFVLKLSHISTTD